MASTEVPAHGDNVLYSERQRVPLTWWFFAAGVVFIIAWQAQMGRSVWYAVGAGVFAGLFAAWMLLKFSATEIAVVQRADGRRWLHAGHALNDLGHRLFPKVTIFWSGERHWGHAPKLCSDMDHLRTFRAHVHLHVTFQWHGHHHRT